MNRAEMMDVIKRNLAEIVEDVDVAALGEADSLAEIGADSLEVVEVVSRSMKQCGLRVRRTALADARNLGDLLDLFEQAAAK